MVGLLQMLPGLAFVVDKRQNDGIQPPNSDDAGSEDGTKC